MRYGAGPLGDLKATRQANAAEDRADGEAPGTTGMADKPGPHPVNGPMPPQADYVQRQIEMLSPQELQELDAAITPAVAMILTKILGPNFAPMLQPFAQPRGTPRPTPSTALPAMAGMTGAPPPMAAAPGAPPPPAAGPGPAPMPPGGRGLAGLRL